LDAVLINCHVLLGQRFNGRQQRGNGDTLDEVVIESGERHTKIISYAWRLAGQRAEKLVFALTGLSQLPSDLVAVHSCEPNVTQHDVR
jgi:hypothetical protein